MAGEAEFPICSICHEQKTQHLATLSCGHVFHTVCVTAALEYNKKCPECKAPGRQVIPLYLDIGIQPHTNMEDPEVAHLRKQLDISQETARQKQEEMRNRVADLESTLVDCQRRSTAEITALRHEIGGENAKLKFENARLKQQAKIHRAEQAKSERVARLSDLMDVIESPTSDSAGIGPAVERLADKKASLAPASQLKSVTHMLEWQKRALGGRIETINAENVKLKQELKDQLKEIQRLKRTSDQSFENSKVSLPSKKRIRQEPVVHQTHPATSLTHAGSQSTLSFAKHDPITAPKPMRSLCSKAQVKKSSGIQRGRHISRGFDGLGGTKTFITGMSRKTRP